MEQRARRSFGRRGSGCGFGRELRKITKDLFQEHPAGGRKLKLPNIPAGIGRIIENGSSRKEREEIRRETPAELRLAAGIQDRGAKTRHIFRHQADSPAQRDSSILEGNPDTAALGAGQDRILAEPGERDPAERLQRRIKAFEESRIPQRFRNDFRLPDRRTVP